MVPSFEFALRERVSRLSGFRHPSYAVVRGIERTGTGAQQLTVVSDEVQGVRLSDLLEASASRHLPIDIGAALGLVRQLVSAVAILHETVRDAAHGALGSERLILTPNGRLVIVEHVLGSALEQLLFSRERYWTELKIALPRTAGLPRFDHLTDVTQIGVVALSLMIGRRIQDDEYPAKIAEVVAQAHVVSHQGTSEPLAPALRTWLERTLQLDPRGSFPSAVEARLALEKAIVESGSEAPPERVEQLLARHRGEIATDTAMRPARGAASHTPSQAPVASPVVLPTVPVAPVAAPPPASASHAPGSDFRSPASILQPVVSGAESPIPSPAPSPGLQLQDEEPAFERPVGGASRWLLTAAAIFGVVVLGGGGTLAAMHFLAGPPATAPATTGTLVISTDPPGAQASIDGTLRGATPITLTLSAGSHRVNLRGAFGDVRSIPVSITAGSQVAQYVELAKEAATEAPEAIVAADAPAPMPAPTPVPVSEAAPVAGWISVRSRFDVSLYENGQLLGSSRTERIMVPAGRHDLELANSAVGYRQPRTVQVAPGKVATVDVEAPSGTIAINALPWAEVWIDGEKVGETPIGNLSLPIGAHEVVLRHPELGEQRQSALVTLTSPARITADLRKQ